MKNLLLVTFVSLLGFTMQAQDGADNAAKQTDPNAPIMQFEKETIDYGNIEKGSDGKRIFKFTNTGKSPLKIEKVKSSCGCTIPSYPKEDIMPGESNVIEVSYNTNRIGRFSKSVSIYTNAAVPRTVIRIKGNVINPNAPAPIQKQKSILSTDN